MWLFSPLCNHLVLPESFKQHSGLYKHDPVLKMFIYHSVYVGPPTHWDTHLLA